MRQPAKAFSPSLQTRPVSKPSSLHGLRRYRQTVCQAAEQWYGFQARPSLLNFVECSASSF